MAAYHSRRNKREFSLDLDLNTFFYQDDEGQIEN